MKKINCYSKTASIIYLIIFVIFLVVGILPFVLFEEQESSFFKVIWIIIFMFGMSFSIFCFFYYRQYLYIKDCKIILKCTLFKIKEIDIKDCYYVVSNLLSCYGRVFLSEYWICIYSYKETKYFKYGFTNSKKHQRIQLIYTEENLNYIKNYIDKKYDSFKNYIQ